MEYADRLRKLKLPTLAFRRARGDMIEVYKMLSQQNGYDQTIPPILIRNPRQSHWSHSKQIYHQRANKNSLLFSFTHRVQETWNNLPEEVVSAKNEKGEETLLEFEKMLDRHWSDQDILYDNYRASITRKKFAK